VLNNLGKLYNIIRKNSWNKITNAFPTLQTSSCCTCVIWSLSIKIPNNLNKLFSDLLRSYWALSPSKCSPPFLYIAPSVSSSFGRIHGMLLSEYSVALRANFLLLPQQTQIVLSVRISAWLRQKSAHAGFGECRVWGTSFISCLAKESWIRREECAGALSWWSNHFFPHHKSSLLLLTASLHHIQIIFLVHRLAMR